MTSGQLEQAVRKGHWRISDGWGSNNIVDAVFLDRLEGFSREQFELEFAAFWESQGGGLAQTYWEELGKDLLQASK